MSRIRAIRTNVFGMSQSEFAQMLNRSQQAVSKAEQRDSLPVWSQLAIREAAKKRGMLWLDKWFFDPPKKSLVKREAAE
jgi:DNA-binding transcriptional regulator YiaG